MVAADPHYWGSVYNDVETVLKALSGLIPLCAKLAHFMAFAKLIYTLGDGHGIQPSDPNYNAPVGNSPASI